jgi:hypothetical protein
MTVAPELADRLAKLLRVACSTGPDGEKLAAVSRLSAIAAAHDVDWDRAFNGAEIPREDMQRIFDAGYTQGAADKEQELRPARDWTAGSSAEVGNDADRLRVILEAAAKAAQGGLLSDWEQTFSADMLERFRRFGSRMYVSEKQWSSLDRLETKMRRAGVL